MAQDKKTPKLVRGPKARTRKGFAENIKREEKLGKGKKRAVGTAYGEAYLGIDKLEKNAAKRKKMHADEKADKRLVKKMVKPSALKKK